MMSQVMHVPTANTLRPRQVGVRATPASVPASASANLNKLEYIMGAAQRDDCNVRLRRVKHLPASDWKVNDADMCFK